MRIPTHAADVHESFECIDPILSEWELTGYRLRPFPLKEAILACDLEPRRPRRRAWLAGSSSSVGRLPVDGGWYVLLEVPRTIDEDAWVALLIREEGIVVHPGYFFDMDASGYPLLSLLAETRTSRTLPRA